MKKSEHQAEFYEDMRSKQHIQCFTVLFSVGKRKKNERINAKCKKHGIYYYIIHIVLLNEYEN